VSQGGLAASLNRGWTTSLPGASGLILDPVGTAGKGLVSGQDPSVGVGGEAEVEQASQLRAAARWCSQWSFLFTPR
jgi:hypothetical protein